MLTHIVKVLVRKKTSKANNKILFVSPFPTYCEKSPLPKIFFSTSEKHILFICVISLGRKFWVRNGNIPLCLSNIRICKDSKYNVQYNYVTCACIDVRKLICMCVVHVDLPPVRTVEYFYSLNLRVFTYIKCVTLYTNYRTEQNRYPWISIVLHITMT